MSTHAAKTSISVDKRNWSPSLLPGQIVLVSTRDTQDRPNIAPKSWVTMVALCGPIVAFGCNVNHTTYQAIAESHEFAVKIPDASLAGRTWRLMNYHGAGRLEHGGFTLMPAQKIGAPLIAECRAHVECVFDSEKRYGDEVMVFGRIVAASADADCLRGAAPDQYLSLRPVFFPRAP